MEDLKVGGKEGGSPEYHEFYGIAILFLNQFMWQNFYSNLNKHHISGFVSWMHLCVTHAHCGYEVDEYKGKLKQHFPQPLTLPTLSRVLLSWSKQKSQPCRLFSQHTDFSWWVFSIRPFPKQLQKSFVLQDVVLLKEPCHARFLFGFSHLGPGKP